MRCYSVAEYNGLGDLNFEADWNEDEVVRRCAHHGEPFDAQGGMFSFDEYNAGTQDLPSWRSSSFEYELVPF